MCYTLNSAWPAHARKTYFWRSHETQHSHSHRIPHHHTRAGRADLLSHVRRRDVSGGAPSLGLRHRRHEPDQRNQDPVDRCPLLHDLHPGYHRHHPRLLADIRNQQPDRELDQSHQEHPRRQPRFRGQGGGCAGNSGALQGL